MVLSGLIFDVIVCNSQLRRPVELSSGSRNLEFVQFRIKRETFPLVVLFRYRLTTERCVGTVVSYASLVPIAVN